MENLNQDTQPEWEKKFIKQFCRTFNEGELVCLVVDDDVDESHRVARSVIAFIRQVEASAERRIAEKLLQDVYQMLFVADTLTEQDLKRGFMALKHPEVLQVYQDDMAKRLQKFEALQSKYLTLREDNNMDNQDTQPEWEKDIRAYLEAQIRPDAMVAYVGKLIVAAERRMAEKIIAEIPEATLTESYIDATLDLKEHLKTKFLIQRGDK